MHDIAVIRKSNGRYKLCPIFDNGACLMSDITFDYPLSKDTFKLIDKVKSKTVAIDFNEQLEECEKLFGNNVKFSWNRNDIVKLLNNADIYPDEIKNRVFDVLMEQKESIVIYLLVNRRIVWAILIIFCIRIRLYIRRKLWLVQQF